MNKKIISAALATFLLGGVFAFSQFTEQKELPETKTAENVVEKVQEPVKKGLYPIR